MNLLITGGAGFIGSNFVRYILKKYPRYKVIILDKLTYAGNLDNLKQFLNPDNLYLNKDYLTKYPHHLVDELKVSFPSNDFLFIQGDICDAELVGRIFSRVDVVVNFAAETHVDRSIMEAGSFVTTDVYGTYVLLEAAKKYRIRRYIQISTDEVYGEAIDFPSREDAPLNPKSPYAASKAGGDRLAFSYWATYNLPIIVTRCVNNFGPYQFPEKLIPLFITNALKGKPLPVYGDGKNTREWIYAEDHCRALDIIMHSQDGVGEVFNIGSGIEKSILDITKIILKVLGKPDTLIQFVKDRAGHVRRHAVDTEKMRKKFNWSPQIDFEEGMERTVRWYVKNKSWWREIKEKSKDYQEYYQKQYILRERTKKQD
ncbi:dTDP-glucose 4,6-dehydratase [Candidatus Aerophobetes bacterium]|nr:dTDP-glucose 4,6-dehydratase [Candidatus Aerophobetes bacterium]